MHVTNTLSVLVQLHNYEKGRLHSIDAYDCGMRKSDIYSHLAQPGSEAHATPAALHSSNSMRVSNSHHMPHPAQSQFYHCEIY